MSEIWQRYTPFFQTSKIKLFCHIYFLFFLVISLYKEDLQE